MHSKFERRQWLSHEPVEARLNSPVDQQPKVGIRVLGQIHKTCRETANSLLGGSGTTLDDVAGDAHGGATHVRRQTEQFFLGKNTCHPIEIHDNMVGNFKRSQFGVISHGLFLPKVQSLKPKV